MFFPCSLPSHILETCNNKWEASKPERKLSTRPTKIMSTSEAEKSNSKHYYRKFHIQYSIAKSKQLKKVQSRKQIEETKITFHAELAETSSSFIRSNCALASLFLLATAVRIKLSFEIIEIKFTKLNIIIGRE